ncbi:MAG: ABC transporter substrate-binding protein [Hymenobacter sp.]
MAAGWRCWPARRCWPPARATASRPADERRVFRYNQPEALTSLDPAFARNQANGWATAQLYNGLLALDSTLQAAPGAGPPLPDFARRADLHLHAAGAACASTTMRLFQAGRGRAVTAADFAYSFRRLFEAKTASPGGWIFRGKVLEDSRGELSDTCFVAANDSTLRIHLKAPFIPFLGMLTMPYAYVVPHEAVARYGKDFRAHPVGTGPFRFHALGRGQRAALPTQP